MGWFLSGPADHVPSFGAFSYMFLRGGKTVLKGALRANTVWDRADLCRKLTLCVDSTDPFANKRN